MLQPPYERHLSQVKNTDGHKIGLRKLTVAYSRPLNLGNILSYRKIDSDSGPQVSSFAITNNAGPRERDGERERGREGRGQLAWTSDQSDILN